MTKGERMATPPWMPPEFGNDAVLIKALGDRINELCHQLERVEHDRDRYANRISELDLLIQTAEEYAKAQDGRIHELTQALRSITPSDDPLDFGTCDWCGEEAVHSDNCPWRLAWAP